MFYVFFYIYFVPVGCVWKCICYFSDHFVFTYLLILNDVRVKLLLCGTVLVPTERKQEIMENQGTESVMAFDGANCFSDLNND